MKKILLLLPIAFFAVMSCASDNETNNNTIANADVALQGEYILNAVEIAEETDLDGDGNANNNLLSETDCYNSGKLIFSENGSFIYILSNPEVTANGLSCATSMHEGTWEYKSRNAECTVIMAVYTDDYGDEQNMLLCKTGDTVSIKYIMANYPVRNEAGAVRETTGEINYRYTKSETLL